jgi:hypothetical protein
MVMTRDNAYAFVRPILVLCGFAAAAAVFVFSPKVPAATFTYTNASCTSFTLSGTPPTQTLTCVSSGGGGGGGVPTCTPTANPPSPAINTQTTLSANCTNTPTSYLWSGGTCGGDTAATCSVTKAKATTITYSVTATNAAGTSAPAQISVTWH